MERNRLKVLLVEDNEDDYLIVRDLLGDADGPGFEIVWRSDGTSGLEAIAIENADICLVDYRLGDYTGLELLREARQRGCGTPFILLTGQGDHNIDVQAMEAGASDYLVKDLLQAGLLERSIRYALERHRQQEILAEQVSLAALGAEIGSVLTRRDALAHILGLCARPMLERLDALTVHIWTLNEARDALDLQAYAFQTPHGPAEALRRVEVGTLEVGRIAAERKPHLTDDAVNDPRLGEAEWPRTHGMTSFAGYPLMVQDSVEGLDRLVGVLVLTAAHPLSAVALKALPAVAEEIALGIERKRTEEELRRSRDDLEVRVRDRTAELASANASMQAAKEEAERANQSKSEFLSRMSHELRTPLNAILGFAQLLEMGQLDAKDMAGVAQILKAGEHLLALINEVLDLSRIDAGEMNMSLEPVPLSVVIQETIDLVHPAAQHRDLHVINRVPTDDSTHVIADRQRLKQVMLNLLSNAVKYNRVGGDITVSYRATGTTIQIEIRDTGIGIAADKLNRLFVPFDRLGAEQSTVEGTGIGLALTKRLVEAMHGAIQAHSEIGSGSAFTVEFAPAEEPRLPQETGQLETIASPDSGNNRSSKVLYIEDNLSNLSLVESILSMRPAVELIVAMQGRLGIDLAHQHHPDLILLDLHLPDINGDHVLQELRGDSETSGIPIVMISADATPRQIQRMLGEGADDYLSKPIDVKRFLGVLDQYLKSTRKETVKG